MPNDYRYDCPEHRYLSDDKPCPECKDNDYVFPGDMGEKKYYMGVSSLGSRDTLRKTLDEAVQECATYLTNNPNCKERYIVKVVKRVRRNPPPVVVEDVV